MRKLAADSGMLITYARDSISRVARMARTVKRTFGVSAVGILMTVIMEVTIAVGYLIRKTLVYIWKYKYKQSFSLRFGPVLD